MVDLGKLSDYIFGRKSDLQGKRDYYQQADECDDDSGSILKTSYADQSSLFLNNKDGNLVIWKWIGWAFNCSAKWPKRWEYWEPVLQFLVELLEQDLLETKRVTNEDKSIRPKEISLFLNSIYTSDNLRSARRRIVHAILADGESRHSQEFTEVIEGETKRSKAKEPPKKKTKLDLDHDKWGDYDGNEDDDMIDESMMDDENDANNQNEPDLPATALRARFLELVRYYAAY